MAVVLKEETFSQQQKRKTTQKNTQFQNKLKNLEAEERKNTKATNILLRHWYCFAPIAYLIYKHRLDLDLLLLSGYTGLFIAVCLIRFTQSPQNTQIRSIKTQIRQLKQEFNNWQRELYGEMVVARELEALPEEYYVLNNIYINFGGEKPIRTQVDHIVVGPTGVFAINTSNLSGQLAGRQNYWLRNRTQRIPHMQAHAIYAAQVVGRITEYAAFAVVVLTHKQAAFLGPNTKHCSVLRPEALVPFILKQPNTIDNAEDVAFFIGNLHHEHT